MGQKKRRQRARRKDQGGVTRGALPESRFTSAPCIVTDLDNTIIDTAVRKFNLIRRQFPELTAQLTIEDVRSDFWLSTVLGDRKSPESASFFRLLDEEATVREFPAPAWAGSRAALAFLRSRGYRIAIMTARPVTLRSVTLEEIASDGLSTDPSELYFVGLGRPNEARTKRELIQELSSSTDILSVIGDRGEDVRAAHANGIPAVLFASTLGPEEIESLRATDRFGLTTCDTWEEIPAIVERVKAGSAEMRNLRDVFIEHYASWLGDIDKKAAIGVTVAGAIAAISGKLLFDLTELQGTREMPLLFSGALLGVAFFLSTLSLLYSVRAYSSRHTSGRLAGRGVRGAVRHWLGILLGGPQRFIALEGDALEQLRELRKVTEAQRARAHLRFFYERYGTYDVDGLKNLMLFDLRASNYQKLYAERAAAKLLLVAILILALWIGLRVAGVINSGPGASGAQGAEVEEQLGSADAGSTGEFRKDSDSKGEASRDLGRLQEE